MSKLMEMKSFEDALQYIIDNAEFKSCITCGENINSLPSGLYGTIIPYEKLEHIKEDDEVDSIDFSEDTILEDAIHAGMPTCARFKIRIKFKPEEYGYTDKIYVMPYIVLGDKLYHISFGDESAPALLMSDDRNTTDIVILL